MKRVSFLIFASMRPKQWIKNILVFVALIFSKNVFDMAMLGGTSGAFVVYRSGKGGHPELVFFEDRRILVSILLYIFVVGLIIYL